MAFNPLTECGVALDKQLRNWAELNSQPYDKHQIDPYTRCRIIKMNSIEVESILFSHQFARHTDNPLAEINDRVIGKCWISWPGNSRLRSQECPIGHHLYARPGSRACQLGDIGVGACHHGRCHATVGWELAKDGRC